MTALHTTRRLRPPSRTTRPTIVDRHRTVGARVIGPVTYTTLKGLLEDEIAATGGAR